MDLTELKFICTSFILSNHQAWKKLNSDYRCTFINFSRIVEDLPNAGKNEDVVCLFFLNDFVEDILESEEVNTVISNIIRSLDMSLKKSSGNIIFCYSTSGNYNVLSSSKVIDYAKKYSYLLNLELSELAGSHEALFLIDMDAIFSQTGLVNCFDLRNWYFSYMRLSGHGMEVLSESLQKILSRIHLPPKKVLVLDCDNTLWGGVVSEDGAEGLILGGDSLGRAYSDFQRTILQKYNSGIVLALNSKNDQEDVLNVFDNNPNMILKKEHITAKQINWRKKSDNLIELSKELNLGLDSFVFWDDNPIERQDIRFNLPEVSVIDVPTDVETWPKILAELDLLSRFYVIKEDSAKNYQYKIKAKFDQDIAGIEEKKKFFKKIHQQIKHIPIDKYNLQRAEQICLKTNQFNFRSMRHTSINLKQMFELDTRFAFLTQLTDDYGDYGLIGLVIVRQTSQGVNYIDTFALSCRAFGREVEHKMIENVIIESRKIGISELFCEINFNIKNTEILNRFMADLSNIFNDSLSESDIQKARVSKFDGKIYKIDIGKSMV